MAISGIIESTSAITLARVLERIFDHEQPGRLRLRHRDTGRTAEVKIERGAVQDTVYGDLTGDDAMKQIAQTYPWEYEFVSEDPTITTGRLPVQPANRPAKKPALKLVGAGKPMMLNESEIAAGFASHAGAPDEEQQARAGRKAAFMAPKSTSAQQPAFARSGQTAAVVGSPAGASAKPQPPAPVRRVKQLPDAKDLADWVAQSDEYALRFAKSGSQACGTVSEADWGYFQADSASLMLWAAGIGDTLGYSAPTMAAIVEPQRAAAYRRLEDGFAGIYCGPDTTVDMIIGIP